MIFLTPTGVLTRNPLEHRWPEDSKPMDPNSFQELTVSGGDRFNGAATVAALTPEGQVVVSTTTHSWDDEGPRRSGRNSTYPSMAAWLQHYGLT